MDEKGWIRWLPGRGRGHLSKLTLLIPIQSLLIDEVKQLAVNGRFNQAFELLETNGLAEEQNKSFLQWLSSSLGYQSEIEGDMRKDTLRLPAYRSLPMLDPCFVTRRTEMHIVKQVFETLAGYDRLQDKFIPGLAHDWETNDNETIWRFYLQKGVPFHHGRMMDAEDIIYTLDRLKSADPVSPYRWMYVDIEEVSTPDPSIIEIKLHNPNHLLLHVLSSAASSIVPRDRCAGDYKRFQLMPSGTGAFKINQNDRSRLVMHAFSDYYGRRPHLDVVEIWILPGIYEKERTDTELGQYGATLFPYHYGQIDQSQWKSKKWTDRGCKFMTVNMARPGPMNNSDLPKALNNVIRRSKMIEELGDNRFTPAFSFLPPEKEEFEESDDPDLLKDFHGIEIHLYTYKGAGNEKDAAWIKEEAAAIGVEIIVTILPYNELKMAENIMNADLILAEHAMDQQEEISLLAAFLNEDGFLFWHMSPESKTTSRRMLKQLQAERGQQTRNKLIVDLEQRLIKNNEVFFLYRWQQQLFFHSNLQGITFNSLGWVDYRDLWFKK